ncbi:MAG: hypothetical protein WC584_04860 [Candidatus Pacearchaeota archaeon]
MAKKGGKKQNTEVKIIVQNKTKKPVRKKKISTPIAKPKKEIKEVRVEKVLVENFIALQQVMTNLSIKFDRLSGEISKLLELFEISAKALAEKDFNVERGSMNSERIAKQMDTLLEQNKIIARGMTLINDRILERNPSEMSSAPIQGRQINPNQVNPQTMQTGDMQGYQRSISSNSNAPPRPM